jgi:CubicO group peptidase (beta-lactamase class C family)
MRLIAIILTLVTLPFAGAADLDQRFLENSISTAVAKWKVPSAVVVAVHGDRSFVAQHGFRTIGSNDRLPDNPFLPLASCTKAFTVALLASMVDDQKIDWDDPVRKHLPEFQISDPRMNELVSIRDLLSHRTGVKGHDFLWYRAPWNRDETLKRYSRLPVEKPFRGSYDYSTLQFMIAGKVAEKAGGKSWADLLRERIAQPLGMHSLATSTSDPRFRKDDIPGGHRRDKNGSITPVPIYETNEPNAAGSLHLAAKDLVPWLHFLIGRGTVAGRRVVSGSAFEEMIRPNTPVPMEGYLRGYHPETVQMTYAMGWLVFDYRGRHVVAHGGMIDGYRVLVAFYPKDRLALAIVNTVQESQLNQALANLIADRALGLEALDWNAILLAAAQRESNDRLEKWNAIVKARRPNVPPSVPVADFAGRYVDDAYGEAVVGVRKGKLIWKWSSFEIELEHWEGDAYRFPSGILEDRFLVFRVGANGVESFQFESRSFIRR